MRLYKNERTNVNYDMDPEIFCKAIDSNIKLVNEINNDCLKKNELLGFIISIPVADGEAFYQVIKIDDKKAKVEYCNTGDDYRDYILGDGGYIRRNIIDSQFCFKKYLMEKRSSEV